MKQYLFAALIALFAQSPPAGPPAPTFRAEPSWPAIPNNWILGEVSSIAVGPQDHVWILHRPKTVQKWRAVRR